MLPCLACSIVVAFEIKEGVKVLCNLFGAMLVFKNQGFWQLQREIDKKMQNIFSELGNH